MADQPIWHSDEAQSLAASSLAAEDFEEASKALLALKRNDRPLAREVTLKILHEHIGDVFYRAHAFEILYSIALDDAVAYIESAATTECTYVLGAMLEAVTEDAGALESYDKILQAVQLLRNALTLRTPEELASLAEQKERFEEAYRSLRDAGPL